MSLSPLRHAQGHEQGRMAPRNDMIAIWYHPSGVKRAGMIDLFFAAGPGYIDYTL